MKILFYLFFSSFFCFLNANEDLVKDYPNEILGVKLSEEVKTWEGLEKTFAIVAYSSTSEISYSRIGYRDKPARNSDFFDVLFFTVLESNNKVDRISASKVMKSKSECSDTRNAMMDMIKKKYPKISFTNRKHYEIRPDFIYESNNVSIKVTIECFSGKYLDYELVDLNLSKRAYEEHLVNKQAYEIKKKQNSIDRGKEKIINLNL